MNVHVVVRNNFQKRKKVTKNTDLRIYNNLTSYECRLSLNTVEKDVQFEVRLLYEWKDSHEDVAGKAWI